jgi:hypothetical protein
MCYAAADEREGGITGVLIACSVAEQQALLSSQVAAALRVAVLPFGPREKYL